ncbi:SIMPL domain-containing protein [bacterium]|nr:SIMPL domain-containing protein [bacterium]
MFKNCALCILSTVILTAPVFALEEKFSIISTDASINKEIAPDTAKIRFYVENSGINLADVKEKNDKTVNTAVNAIKKELNSSEQIKTIAFSVRNVYSYKDKVRVFQKYEVVNGFEVKLKDMDKISKIINLAMQNGVKRIDRVNFLVEDSEAICNSMMAETIKIAKNRVSYLAQSAGTSLDKVKSINPYCSLSSSQVAPRVYNSFGANKSMASVAEDSAIDSIEPGTINAKASVNMTYYLK